MLLYYYFCHTIIILVSINPHYDRQTKLFVANGKLVPSTVENTLYVSLSSYHTAVASLLLD